MNLARSICRLLPLAIALGFAGTAQADSITYVDVEAIGETLHSKPFSSPDWIWGKLDLTNPGNDVVETHGQIIMDQPGFSAPTALDDAWVNFYVTANDDDGRWWEREYALYNVMPDGQGTQRSGEVDVEIFGVATGTLTSWVSHTGMVYWAFAAKRGTIRLDAVALYGHKNGGGGGNTDPAVPEPSAVALFGIGALLIRRAIHRRRH